MPTIKLRRGNSNSIPILSAGEPAIALDTQTLYYGSGTSNINLTPIRWVADTPDYISGTNILGRYTINATSATVDNNYNAIDMRTYISGGVKLDPLGQHSFSTGSGTKAQGLCSFAANRSNIAQGVCSFVTGDANLADGNGHFSFISGQSNTIYSAASLCSGKQNSVQAVCGLCSGTKLTCESFLLTSLGQYNTVSIGDPGGFSVFNNALVIGNGTSSSLKSNCFRVRFDGSVYGLSAFNSSGADYAEYFEWEDGNLKEEDRVGYFVTIANDSKIRYSNADDEILGVVSSIGAFVGNSHSEEWAGKYLKDNFGRFIYNTTYSEDGYEIKTPIVNPLYQNELQYIPREERAEWSPVGLLGIVRVFDNGTCIVGGRCKSADHGIATYSKTGYLVLKRISSNIVEILIK